MIRRSCLPHHFCGTYGLTPDKLCRRQRFRVENCNEFTDRVRSVEDLWKNRRMSRMCRKEV